jgi:topoisomerase IA-like protein
MEDKIFKINLNKAVSLIFEIQGIGNMQRVQNQKEPDHKNQTLHL